MNRNCDLITKLKAPDDWVIDSSDIVSERDLSANLYRDQSDNKQVLALEFEIV